jgi:rubrerythrin
MFTIDDLLEVAIKMEKNGAAVYTGSIQKIQNKQLKSMLKWMADEETTHGKWFAEQKNSLSLKKEEANLKEMVPQVLQDMMGEKTISLDEVDFNTIATASELLATFISFEKDTILFYEMLEIFVEDETVLTGLKKIIREEKTHVEQLTDMMASLSEESV